MRSYSSGLRPWRSSVCCVDGHAVANAFTMDSRMTSPSALPSAGSHARSGCGIMPTTLRALVADAGDGVQRPVRVRLLVDLPSVRRVAEDDLPVRFEPFEHVGRREVVAFAVADRNAQHLADVRTARERRVGLLDADVHVLAAVLQPWLRSIAPGSRPDSSRTWKPLQMPSTGPPRSANACTSRMIGEKRAIAPVRR